MRQQSIPQLGFEPGGLGRHDAAGVRNRHQIVHRRRIHAESDFGVAGVHETRELGGAANAADEVDSLVRPWIADCENRREHAVVQPLHVERAHRVGDRRPRVEREPVPGAGEIHRALALARDGGASRPHRQPRRELGEEVAGRAADEVLDDAVVRQDLHLPVRKRHRQEPARFRAAHVSIGACRARGAMVSVGDVERGHVGERGRNRGADARLSLPERVDDPVGRGDVVERRTGDDLSDRGVHGGTPAVREQHRPALRPGLDDVARAVVLLVGPRLLVLLDEVAAVLVHRERGGDAGLDVATHLQAIDIDRRRGVLLERFRLERRERRGGLRVDGVVVRVRVGGEVDFGPRHVQKAQRIASQRPRLRGAHDVVGNGGNAGRVVAARAEGSKGSNVGHRADHCTG